MDLLSNSISFAQETVDNHPVLGEFLRVDKARKNKKAARLKGWAVGLAVGFVALLQTIIPLVLKASLAFVEAQGVAAVLAASEGYSLDNTEEEKNDFAFAKSF